MAHYDVIVVGARCAGAGVSLLLARMGLRVLCLERAEVSRDTISTHFIRRSGVAKLADWGLLEKLLATGCPPISTTSYQLEEVMARKTTPPGEVSAVAPRRHILDSLLAAAAVRAGVELRERCRVTEVVWSDGRANGVRALSGQGTVFVEHAPLIIGADGMNSSVAKLVGAKSYVEVPSQTCVYYSYWNDADLPAGVTIRNRQAVLAFPTHGHSSVVAAVWPSTRWPAIRHSVESSYLETLRVTGPGLWERLSSATRIEPIKGTGRLPGFFRTAVGPGWALIGDAGIHKDPLPANGISDAWLQADCLARHLRSHYLGDTPQRLALDRFASERDEQFTQSYQGTALLARMDLPKTALIALRETLRQQNKLLPDGTSVMDNVLRSLAENSSYT